MSSRSRGPLNGIRVVECAAWHSGPGADVILGDLGAEVVKIEPLNGDPERKRLAPGADGDLKPYLFEGSNRGKKSICIDLASAEGHAILESFIESADIFVTNMLAKTKSRLKIDYPALKNHNPRLIYLSISGYGQSGKLANLGAFDPLGQAISGMMFMARPDEPIPLDYISLDQMTAVTASHAVLAALVARDRSGAGEEVHVSLYGAALWLLYGGLYAESVLGRPHRLYGPRGAQTALNSAYRCADGLWIQACLTPSEKYWTRLCEAIGRHELTKDPRFATDEARSAANHELLSELETVFARRARKHWLEKLHAEGLLFAPVQTTTDVLLEEQARENGYIASIDHRDFGEIAVPMYPAGFSGHSPAGIGPAPRLGEHTLELLDELDYDSRSIRELIAKRIVAADPGSLQSRKKEA
jgi:crotonobetainyl-CoA:carnitine CoA-transferase CaiB-like acyl-CoA transferase